MVNSLFFNLITKYKIFSSNCFFLKNIKDICLTSWVIKGSGVNMLTSI